MRASFFIYSSLLLSSCAHHQSGSTQKQMEQKKQTLKTICAMGENQKSIKGNLWIKTKSKESSGQFPALIKIEPNGDLDLEVDNLLGGTEAMIRIRGDHYEVIVPKKENVQEKKLEGMGTWAGIPLMWARKLFLGQIPCPRDQGEIQLVATDNQSELAVMMSSPNGNERFTYQVDTWGGQPWAKALVWEHHGQNSMVVEFEFKDPDRDMGVPMVWKAKSSKGEVFVRWQN